MYKICSEVEIIKKNFDNPVDIIDGLQFSQKDMVKTIEYYSNSKYLNGQKDELGRDKAFYNILNGMCDVENAAKDIDTKDITIVSENPEGYVGSFLLSKDIYKWMQEENFALTLNEIKKTHTRYGSVLVKKCYTKDKNGKKKLALEVPEWKNIINDQVDIEGGPIIEVHYMTPTELRKKTEWNQNAVKELLAANKKQVGKRLAVYEVRGEFPRSFYKEYAGEKVTEKDESDFSYQLYYIGGAAQDGSLSVKSLKVLYAEDDTEQVYKFLARKRKAGRAFGCGVVEEGEEAQVQVNNAILKQNRALEYTSKVIGQSASKKLKGRNMFNEVDDGQILEHEDGKPIQTLQLLPSGGLNQYQNIVTQWFNQFERVTSAYSAQRGEQPPSGTPFRLQAAVVQQSSSVFQELQEELGIFLVEIFNDWIMPYLGAQINKEHILAHNFSVEELKWIDERFTTHTLNEMKKEAILSGKIVTPEEEAKWEEEIRNSINSTQGSRFIKIAKDQYKDLDGKVTINITGEQKNKAAALESLNNILITYSQNPNIVKDPVLMQLFLKIVELSGAGISPVSLMAAVQQQKDEETAMPEQVSNPIQEETAQAPQESALSLQANPTQVNA